MSDEFVESPREGETREPGNFLGCVKCGGKQYCEGGADCRREKMRAAYVDRAKFIPTDFPKRIEEMPDAAPSRGCEEAAHHAIHTDPAPPKTADVILSEMAATYRERNAVYGDNYKMVAKLMAILFPDGVPSELVVADHFHLFELILVKLSRFAISNLTHADSIHDTGVYSAMIEAIILESQS